MNFVNNFNESLFCTMVISTLKKEMSSSFNLLAPTTNRTNTILKFVPKIVSSQVIQFLILVTSFNPSLQATKKLDGFRCNEF